MARFKLKYKYFMGGLQITFKVWSNGEIDIKFMEIGGFITDG